MSATAPGMSYVSATARLSCVATARLSCVDTARLSCVVTARLSCVATARLSCVATARLSCVDTARLSCVVTARLSCVATARLSCVATARLRRAPGVHRSAPVAYELHRVCRRTGNRGRTAWSLRILCRSISFCDLNRLEVGIEVGQQRASQQTVYAVPGIEVGQQRRLGQVVLRHPSRQSSESSGTGPVFNTIWFMVVGGLGYLSRSGSSSWT
jgi:hypothetical protein